MKTWGLLLIGTGLLVAFGALIMDTSVASSIGPYGLAEARTYNLGLLQRQELMFMGGCAMFVGGCVVMAIGQLEATLGNLPHANVSPLNHVEESDRAAPVTATMEPLRAPQTLDDDTDYKKLFIIFGGILLAVLALFLAIGPGKSPEAASIEANADMLADNLETTADNLEATVR